MGVQGAMLGVESWFKLRGFDARCDIRLSTARVFEGRGASAIARLKLEELNQHFPASMGAVGSS